jgi:hypothetical protein
MSALTRLDRGRGTLTTLRSTKMWLYQILIVHNKLISLNLKNGKTL